MQPVTERNLDKLVEVSEGVVSVELLRTLELYLVSSRLGYEGTDGWESFHLCSSMSWT